MSLPFFIALIPRFRANSFPTMASSHPQLFQASAMNESEIRKIIVNHFLLDHAMQQWCLATDKDIPTPNANEIVVFSSFFQCGFGLPICHFQASWSEEPTTLELPHVVALTNKINLLK
jgi:hypothetical protein